MAFDSYPNTPHNTRALSLAENEQLWSAIPTGLTGYTGQTPVYGDASGRQVKVRAAVAGRIRGTRFTNVAETIVTLSANTSGNPRIDLVVARLNRATFQVTPVVIPGTAAAAPIAPQPVRNESGGTPDYWDIPLAEVKVANGYTTVAAADVTNRAWWISASGYHGFDAAKPPVEPGAVFRANDSGVTYIGTSGGSWRKLQINGGWVAVGLPSGWSGTLAFCRAGDLVVMSAKILRSGAAVAAAANTTMFTIGDTYRPSITVWGAYHCTAPDHSSQVGVQADGQVIFYGTGSGGAVINQNAYLLANMVWPVAEP